MWEDPRGDNERGGWGSRQPRMESWWESCGKTCREGVSRRCGRKTLKASNLAYFLRWTCTALNTSSRFSTTKSPSRMWWSPGFGGCGSGCSPEPSMTLSGSPCCVQRFPRPLRPATSSSAVPATGLTSRRSRGCRTLGPAPPPRAEHRFRFSGRPSGQLPGASRPLSGRTL